MLTTHRAVHGTQNGLRIAAAETALTARYVENKIDDYDDDDDYTGGYDPMVRMVRARFRGVYGITRHFRSDDKSRSLHERLRNISLSVLGSLARIPYVYPRI